jgi:phosphoesterase RecJ-like protein
MTARARPETVTAAQLADRLRHETRVVAVSHEAPDGDALGCLSAFLLMCERLGIACAAFIPGESGLPSEYQFLPRVQNILRGAAPPVEPGTTIYFFDCASLFRSSSVGFPENVTRVNIDHHQDNPGFGDLNLVDAAAPSSSAILYEIFKAGGFPVDAKVGVGLYVGLVTDTGRFQYSNTTPGAHRMAADLQERGLDIVSVYRQVYESTPLPKLRLLERALCHLEVRLGGALVVSWLGNDDFAQAEADEGHAEGIIDTLRQIHGVRVAALARETRRGDRVETKVSLRSTDGAMDVAALAHRRGGGGHARAAGFTSDEDVPTVLAWISSQVEADL